jgi:hypothetical protein
MPAGARTDSQQITLFDYYDFHIKTTCYHSAGKYLSTLTEALMLENVIIR